MLKCSRCRHIFPADRTQRSPAPQPAAAPPAARPPARRPQPVQPDLDLDFEEAVWEGEQTELASFREDEDYSLGTGADEERTARRARGPATAERREPRLLSTGGATLPPAPAAKSLGAGARPADDGAYSFAEEELDEDLVVGDEAGEAAGAGGNSDEDEDEDRDEDEYAEDDGEDEDAAAGRGDDVKAGRRWATPLILFFSIVVGGYFFLARELMRDRDFAEEFIARLPMVGSSLAADRLLFRKVALADVEGGFVRVKGGKDVFVISGTGLNTASRPLRNIRVEGALVDANGQSVRQETITCGGMDARRLLQGLSLREVEMLGKVEPSRRFRLDPGDSTTFAIVFTNPPANAVDFTARVVSAQR